MDLLCSLFDLYFWDKTSYKNIAYRIQSLTGTELDNCIKHIVNHHQNYDYIVILAGFPHPWSESVILIDKTADWISTNKSMTVFDFNTERC